MRDGIRFLAVASWLILAGILDTDILTAGDVDIAAAPTTIETGIVGLLWNPTAGQLVVTKAEPTQEMVVIGNDGKLVKRVSLGPDQLAVPAVGPTGGYYLVDSKGRATLFGATGRRVRTFRVGRGPVAVGVSGRLYSAATGGDHFGRIFGRTGAYIDSFGQAVSAKSGTKAQRDTLNSGIVAAHPAGGFFFVTRFRPQPTAYRFSDEGELVAKFDLNGSAIELQRASAERSIAARQFDCIGGTIVISAAAVDTSTGHLWVAVPSSTETGVLIEFAATGEKLGEYQLSDRNDRRLLLVDHLIVERDSVFVVSSKILHRFDRKAMRPIARGPADSSAGLLLDMGDLGTYRSRRGVPTRAVVAAVWLQLCGRSRCRL